MYPLLLARQIINLIFIASLSATGTRAVAAIYTCTDKAGQQTFTDRGCPGNSIYQPRANPVVDFAPLTTDEKAQLKSLQRQAEQSRLERQKSNLQRARRLATRQDQRKQDCQAAITALQNIANVRRKGYKLSAEAKLEASQASLQEIKRENC